MKVGEIWKRKPNWRGYKNSYNDKNIRGRYGYVQIVKLYENKNIKEDFVSFNWLYEIYANNLNKWYCYENLHMKRTDFLADFQKVYGE